MQNKTLNERKSIYANSNLSGFQYSFTHQMTTLNTLIIIIEEWKCSSKGNGERQKDTSLKQM